MTTPYYNRNIIDQQRRDENTEFFTLLPLVNDMAATTDSDMQDARGCTGVIISIIFADKKNAGSYTPSIITKDDAGNVITLVAFTAITANGTVNYWVHPHADKTATIKNSFTELGTTSLPKKWWLRLTRGGGATDTFDIEAHAAYVK